MARIDQRRSLSVLPRERLLELVESFQIDLDATEPDHVLVDGLARSRRAAFDKILARLSRDELRRVLEASGVTPESDDEYDLRAAILGGALSASGQPGSQVGGGRREQGQAFEVEFRKHMLEDLGFWKVTRNEWCKGRVADRGYDCDLHGVQYPALWGLLNRAGIIMLALAFFALAAPNQLTGLGNFAEGLAQWISPDLAGSGLLVLGGGAFFIALIGKQRAIRHVWVECKNRQTPIKRTDVLKLVNAADDVSSFRDASWSPHELWIASKQSPFDQDARNFAEEHDVRCFEWKDGTAVEIVPA